MIKDILNNEQKQLVANIIVDIEKKDKEIERLHSIIKEVREKLNNYTTRMEVLNYQISDLTKRELLEMLDKVGETNVKD